MQVANKTQLKLEQEKGPASVCLFKCVFVFSSVCVCVCASDVLLRRAYFSSPYSLSSDRSSKPPVQALGNWNEARRKRGWMGKKEKRCDGGEKGWSAKKGRTGEERRQRQTDRAAAHGTAQNGKN